MASGNPKIKPKPLTTNGLISSRVGRVERLKVIQIQAAAAAITARIVVINVGEKSANAIAVRGNVAAKHNTPIKPSKYAYAIVCRLSMLNNF